MALTYASRICICIYLPELTSMLDGLAVISMHVQDQTMPTALPINARPTFMMR